MTEPARDAEIMLVVGEASGDQLGAQLIAAINALGAAHVRITGVGGPAMIAQGMKPLFSIETTAVMGLREVVPRIPAILQHRSTGVMGRPPRPGPSPADPACSRSAVAMLMRTKAARR